MSRSRGTNKTTSIPNILTSGASQHLNQQFKSNDPRLSMLFGPRLAKQQVIKLSAPHAPRSVLRDTQDSGMPPVLNARISSNTVASILRLGFWSMRYYSHNEEPSGISSVSILSGASLRPFLKR